MSFDASWLIGSALICAALRAFWVHFICVWNHFHSMYNQLANPWIIMARLLMMSKILWDVHGIQKIYLQSNNLGYRKCSCVTILALPCTVSKLWVITYNLCVVACFREKRKWLATGHGKPEWCHSKLYGSELAPRANDVVCLYRTRAPTGISYLCEYVFFWTN